VDRLVADYRKLPGLLTRCNILMITSIDSSMLLWATASLDEGNIWEAAMFAGKYKLSQLIAFIDRNNIQIDGTTENVMPLEDLKGKWESFGWHVIEIDGHNIQSIIDAVNLAKAITNRPCVIIAYTIAGKGVDFMEYDYNWHGKAPNTEQAAKALHELGVLDDIGNARGYTSHE
jgi:transketolase